jgi:hypothetical protein
MTVSQLKRLGRFLMATGESTPANRRGVFDERAAVST